MSPIRSLPAAFNGVASAGIAASGLSVGPALMGGAVASLAASAVPLTAIAGEKKMIQPSTPWPRATRFDDALSEIVAAGDIAGARNYFDTVFWEAQKERPGFKHLRLALMREDLPMVRLLATWGAHPSHEDMAILRAQEADKYLRYVQLLRQGGLRSNGQPWEEITPNVAAAAAVDDPVARQGFVDGKFVDKRVEQIPQEWRRVLQGFQANGANEAVIAGGALRDLFNRRAIRDVDIFMRSQGSQKKNRQFIEAVFNAAGVPVQAQSIRYDGGGYGFATRQENFPDPKGHTEKTSDPQLGKRVRTLESWKILAGKDKTEYNLIFVEDTLDRKLAKEASKFQGKSIFVGGLLESFDIGITQIATDGEEIVSTRAYDEDVRLKRLTLLRPNDATVDHAARIIQKYPDFEQSRELKELMKPKPRPTPRYDSWS
ncbi:MAG TPA: hypothetical protein VEF76_14140 [Patescibacteria group bacterium]|nr:hypothetical protein [Patescibacteria group bacterium]